MVISNNSSKNIMKDYLEVALDTKVEVLEVMDNNKIKFEVKECMKEPISGLYRNRKYNIKYKFFFSMHTL